MLNLYIKDTSSVGKVVYFGSASINIQLGSSLSENEITNI